MYVVYIFDRRLEINGPMTVVTELPSKLSYIRHVEEDKLSPGSVLFATPFALTRTDNSRLDVIAGFFFFFRLFIGLNWYKKKYTEKS